MMTLKNFLDYRTHCLCGKRLQFYFQYNLIVGLSTYFRTCQAVEYDDKMIKFYLEMVPDKGKIVPFNIEYYRLEDKCELKADNTDIKDLIISNFSIPLQKQINFSIVLYCDCDVDYKLFSDDISFQISWEGGAVNTSLNSETFRCNIDNNLVLISNLFNNKQTLIRNIKSLNTTKTLKLEESLKLDLIDFKGERFSPEFIKNKLEKIFLFV